MNKITALILILSSYLTVAQDKTKERVFQVTGISRTYLTPDVGILYIRLSNIDTGMNKAIEGLTKKSDYFTSLLIKLGYKKEDIKTTGFSVSVNRIYRRDQMVDSGYIASQTVKLEFKNDKENLSRILTKMANGEKDTDFSFEFKLSDKLKEETQLKLIDAGFKDAAKKAEVLAASSGKKISGLKSVLYVSGGFDGPEPFVRRDFKMASAEANGAGIYNFNPDDILLQESVSAEWYFE